MSTTKVALSTAAVVTTGTFIAYLIGYEKEQLDLLRTTALMGITFGGTALGTASCRTNVGGVITTAIGVVLLVPIAAQHEVETDILDSVPWKLGVVIDGEAAPAEESDTTQNGQTSTQSQSASASNSKPDISIDVTKVTYTSTELSMPTPASGRVLVYKEVDASHKPLAGATAQYYTEGDLPSSEYLKVWDTDENGENESWPEYIERQTD